MNTVKNRSVEPSLLSLGRGALVSLLLVALVVGCRPKTDRVRSHLEGQIRVQSTIDPSDDHSGFRVLVVNATGRIIDTLGQATTNRDGRFEMTVTAPERDIYTLTVWGRQGQERLAATDYVVADGDTASVEATFPLQNKSLRVRSEEHAALSGYRNALAQHRRILVERLQADLNNSNAVAHRVRQTSSVLWSLQKTFPGTYAADLAAVESLSLLAGWNDSLVVDRAKTIDPSNPRFVEAAQIARRSAARLGDQQAALDLLTSFESRASTRQQQAGLQAARVQAFIDSLQTEAALSAAEDLKNAYPNTKWAEWADRATYEVNNLLPGKDAPSLTARTLAGGTLSLDSLQGAPVVLEYFAPDDRIFGQQMPTRNALYDATRSDSVSFVSVSVTPDTLLNRALLENRSLPGHYIIAPRGREDPIAKAYNVADVPVRFLIGADGRIVGRYDGTAFLALQEDLARLLRTDEAPTAGEDQLLRDPS